MKKLNVDPRHNPKTTGLGIVLLLPALAVVFGEYFYELKTEINYWIVCSVGAFGIALVVSPDSVITIIKNGFNSIIKKYFK